MTTIKQAAGANRAALKNKKSRPHCNSTPAQRKRILDYLIEHGSMTTADARQSLDIMHPAGRIAELRKKGVDIRTAWTIINTGKSWHRIARYVLIKLHEDKHHE